MAAKTVGKFLAKAFGIDPDQYRQEIPETLVQHSTDEIPTFEPYIEELPTIKSQDLLKLSNGNIVNVVWYIAGLFPFTRWIRRYNSRWLLADIIAGFTLALIMIPQGLSYATLANLSPEYGLYTTLTGTLLYWVFGTSKDVAIGATAVVSLLVGKSSATIIEKHPQFTKEEVAKAHAFLAGCIFLSLGICRLGFILEFIPHIATSAFVTAAAITIVCGQIPPLLGISDINTREPAYQVFINTCRHLGEIKVDAAIGFTAFALLTFIKWICEYMIARQPRSRGNLGVNQSYLHKKQRDKIWATVSSLRFLLTISLYVLVSFLVNRTVPSQEAKFQILGRIPVGFSHVGPPTFRFDLINSILPELPAAVIIIIIEHVAIAKSFGRKNNYSISPSQELVALAATNIAGPFIGAYASTASFGGSAVFSKAGVRTPLAGIFNGAVIILTLFVLQPVLYWIPKACLAALIIHAVGNLIEPPSHIYRLWMISPPDVIIYLAGVFTSIFSSLENGIYLSIIASAVFLLLRISTSNGQFMGRVWVYQYSRSLERGSIPADYSSTSPTVLEHRTNMPSREAYFALKHNGASNPSLRIKSPHPGIFIYRFPDGFNYINQTQHLDRLAAIIMEQTRRTEAIQYEHLGDRPWNEPLSSESDIDASKPTLKAVILDFSTVYTTDTAAIDGLAELREQLHRWAKPDLVEWHFANVEARWVRRALVAAGFGYLKKDELEGPGNWRSVFTLAERERRQSDDSLTSSESGLLRSITGPSDRDVERGAANVESTPEQTRKLISTHGINYPYFHLDLAAAVEAVGGYTK